MPDSPLSSRGTADGVSLDCAFDGLTDAQQAALANVAFGGRGGGVSAKTLAALASRELITSIDCRDGPFRWTEWEMPLPVHIAFCEWCSRTDDERDGHA